MDTVKKEINNNNLLRKADAYKKLRDFSYNKTRDLDVRIEALKTERNVLSDVDTISNLLVKIRDQMCDADQKIAIFRALAMCVTKMYNDGVYNRIKVNSYNEEGLAADFTTLVLSELSFNENEKYVATDILECLKENEIKEAKVKTNSFI